MPDTRRLPVTQLDEAAARADQIDALIEDGLDRYFGGRYEDAIHLWTRVLFLDRSHARARAYIDRARTAVAEVQRRSEELLQASRDLLDQGQTEGARHLLGQAVAASGDDVQASALRAKLERLERALATEPRVLTHSPVEVVPGWTWRPTPQSAVVASLAILSFTTLVAVAGIAWLTAGNGVSVPFSSPPAAVENRLPVLTGSEVALVRARALFARGRLSEALQKLEGVAPESAARAAADELRVEIQQLLLASVRSSASSDLLEPVRR